MIIVGGSGWSAGLASKLIENGVPALIIDNNWNELRDARAAGIATHFGEALSETVEFALDLGGYGTLIAATPNDAYNTLVTNDYVFDFGRQNTFQISPAPRKHGTTAQTEFTLGGRPMMATQLTVTSYAHGGHELGFSATKLTPKFGLADLVASKDSHWVPVLAIKPDKTVIIATSDKAFQPAPDDIVIGH